MAYKKDITDLAGIRLECMGSADPMLHMLEWLCGQRMEAEISSQIGAEKNEQSMDRSSLRKGYRPRRRDTRMGTMSLMIPKVRNDGDIPSLLRSANAAKQPSFRSSRKPIFRAFPPERLRS